MMSKSAGRGSTASLARARAEPQAERVSASKSRLRANRRRKKGVLQNGLLAIVEALLFRPWSAQQHQPVPLKNLGAHSRQRQAINLAIGWVNRGQLSCRTQCLQARGSRTYRMIRTANNVED